jgi:mannose-1-phosphate guanylyltransferase / mannose-6-phosphate isomerase
MDQKNGLYFMKIIPVILSGGSGTRLWPLSREKYPKQYLSIIKNRTLLQETILRLEGLDNISDPIIVCNTDHRFLVAEQCQQIGIKKPTILLEKNGRNTAPAITAAAIHSMNFSNDILLILSADHLILDIEAFHESVKIAYKYAQKGKLAIFGIKPNNPNTHYGYIKTSMNSFDDAMEVLEFVEKPDISSAKSFIKTENYLWNSGMFMFQAETLVNELSIYSPKIVSAVKIAIDNSIKDLDFIRLDSHAFESSPSISIDFALMEKSDNLIVIPLNSEWNDIGSWSALYDIGEKDKDGNVVLGDAITLDTSNTYVSANHHIVVTFGVDNLIIVDTPDAAFISTMEKVDEIKDIHKLLKSKNRIERTLHRKVFRPWGWFDSIESGENFQVKRLSVNPKARLSLQIHHKRAEHWVVINGIATITKDDQVFTLRKGESTYIPIGVKHSIENQTEDPLEIIEVQSGVYLGEDDIVRFEDIYVR